MPLPEEVRQAGDGVDVGVDPAVKEGLLEGFAQLLPRGVGGEGLGQPARQERVLLDLLPRLQPESPFAHPGECRTHRDKLLLKLAQSQALCAIPVSMCQCQGFDECLLGLVHRLQSLAQLRSEGGQGAAVFAFWREGGKGLPGGALALFPDREKGLKALFPRAGPFGERLQTSRVGAAPPERAVEAFAFPGDRREGFLRLPEPSGRLHRFLDAFPAELPSRFEPSSQFSAQGPLSEEGGQGVARFHLSHPQRPLGIVHGVGALMPMGLTAGRGFVPFPSDSRELECPGWRAFLPQGCRNGPGAGAETFEQLKQTPRLRRPQGRGGLATGMRRRLQTVVQAEEGLSKMLQSLVGRLLTGSRTGLKTAVGQGMAHGITDPLQGGRGFR